MRKELLDCVRAHEHDQSFGAQLAPRVLHRSDVRRRADVNQGQGERIDTALDESAHPLRRLRNGPGHDDAHSLRSAHVVAR